MNAHKLVSLLAAISAAGLLAGCDTEPESHLVTAPPPPPPTATAVAVAPAPQTVVVAQPAAVVATAGYPSTVASYVVMQAPPAPPPEAIPAQPGSDYVWIAGYWTWQNSQYAWMGGHWEVPPTHSSVWHNPHWEPEGSAFRFYEGHWD